MSVLLISSPQSNDSSFINIFPVIGLPSETNYKNWNGWSIQPIELRRKKHYCLEYELSEGIIAFVHTGISKLTNKRKSKKPESKSNKKENLVFDGLNFTLKNLIQSFLYITPPYKKTSSEQPYTFKYHHAVPPVVIFLFVDEITDKVAEVITHNVGVDPFGRYTRKVYVIAIPLLYQAENIGIDKQALLDNYLYILARLINNNVSINDVLKVFPNSKHFAQWESFDSDGKEEQVADSLRRALRVSFGDTHHRNSEIDDIVSKTLKELKLLNKYSEENSISKDEVYCTLYAPQEVSQNSVFLIQIFAHTELESKYLKILAQAADDLSRQRATNSLGEKLGRGSKIAFQLYLNGLIIDEPMLLLNWDGKINYVQFGVKVPPDFSIGDIIGKVIILLDTIPIGQLKFKLSIIPGNHYSYSGKSSASLEHFKNAFICYASQDRPEVLKRVQMLNIIKLNFFQDLLTLEPGEEWEKKIYSYIDECDIFFLFWSKAASESSWVKKEISYAVKVKESNNDTHPEIIPVLIEGPPPPKPPEELSFLHFNDKFIYFINSQK